MSNIIIFYVLNAKINYLYHLDKFNVVNNYIWRVTMISNIFFSFRSNIKNTYLLRNLMHEIYIFDVHNLLMLIMIIFRLETIKTIILTSFFAKSLKWLSFILSNVTYIYLCHILIFLHLEKFTKSNDCLTMEWYTNHVMIINYTLIFIWTMWYFR